jgi:ATP-dependent Clp protease adapter protein ClpS
MGVSIHQRELRNAVARAVARARAARRVPSVYDLFAALVESSEVHLMIHRTGGDSDALAAALESAANSVPDPTRLRRLWLKLVPHAPFRPVMAIASLRRPRAAGREVGPADVFAAGFDAGDRGLVVLLERAGLSRARVLRWLCADPEDPPDSIPEGDRLDVVMLNDDFTPMETVVRVLKTVFAFDDHTAFATMLAVHRQGSARLGQFDRDEAIRLVGAATAMAEGEGAPLRVVLRSPAPPVESDVSATAPAGVVSRAAPPARAVSSDRVAIAYGIAALTVWLAVNRYTAGSSVDWYPQGITGVTWYGAGVFALAWVLHRGSGGRGSYGRVLAAIARVVPLALVVALTIDHWAKPSGARICYVLLAAAALMYARRVVARLGARRPWAGFFAAAAFIAAFAWATDRAYVTARFWYAATDDADYEDWADSERLIFEQPDRIDAAAAGLRAGSSDRPNVFFLGFAGTGEERVFAEEAKLAERVVSERYGAAGRTLLLVNDRRDLEARPLATVSGLRRALVRLGERMDRAKDVLFLVLTSHGSTKYLAVSNTTWPLEQLEPPALRSALDASRIKWRVIVISACHSGAFIPALSDDNTAIFTAAAADRASFGCSDDRDVTEFGTAFIRDALPRAPSLVAAFEQAKETLAAHEKGANRKASLPQSRFGAALAAHWERIEAHHRPALATGPSSR